MSISLVALDILIRFAGFVFILCWFVRGQIIVILKRNFNFKVVDGQGLLLQALN